MTAQPKQLWGLPIIEPDTQTIGVALSVGVKPKGGGWPIEKDRFHIVQAKTREREEGGKKVDYRPYDTRFEAYNNADLETRTVFYGTLCYHYEKEVWNPSYGMYRFPKGRGDNPRTKRFACTGNGVDAQRWLEGELRDIPCPGEECGFRSLGQPPACMPRARFWFMPRWIPSQGKAFARWLPDGSVKQLLPRPIMRLATQGREARDTFAGMLKLVRNQAAAVDFEVRSWFGLQFAITLSQGKNAEKGTKWPDITFSLDEDWMSWVQWQAGQFRQLAEAPEMLALGAASGDEIDPEAAGAEHAAIVPSVGKPAVVALPAEKEVDFEAAADGYEPVEDQERGDPTDKDPVAPEPETPIGDEGETKLDAHWAKTRKARGKEMPLISTIARTEGLSINLATLMPDEGKRLWKAISAYKEV